MHKTIDERLESAKYCWLNKQQKSDRIVSKQRRMSILLSIQKIVVSERVPPFLFFVTIIRENCHNLVYE